MGPTPLGLMVTRAAPQGCRGKPGGASGTWPTLVLFMLYILNDPPGYHWGLMATIRIYTALRHDLAPCSGPSPRRCWGTGAPQAHIYVEGNHLPMVHFMLYIPRRDP